MPTFSDMVYHSGGAPVGGEMTAGNIWWVDSGSSLAADAVTNGKSREVPFATLDYAIGRCTANNGDVIYVAEGHSETKSATGSLLACDIEGVSIIGLGDGADRPTLTLSHTGAAMTISAANVTWKNLLIVAGIDSITAPLTISAADCTLDGIEFRDTTDIEAVQWVLTTAAADRLRILNCFHNGYTGGNACVNFARLVGVDGCLIEGCRFHGNYSTAIIEFHTTSCTKVDVLDCVFNDTGTTDLSDNIVDTVGSSTWFVDSQDLAFGGHFSGGSGNAVAGDDVGAVSTAVSTVDSKVVVVSTAVSTVDSKVVVVSTAVSTVDSKVVSANTALSTSISTADSKVTVVSTAVSTVDSKVVSANTALSTSISTADSKVTVVSTAVSTVDSKVTVVSTAVSTVDSKVVSANTALSTSISTADSKVAVVSTAVSTVDSKVVSANTALSTSISTADSKVTVVSTAVSTVDSKVVSANTALSTSISTVDSKVVVASTAVSTVDSKVTVVSTAVSTADSKVVLWGGQHEQQDTHADGDPLASGTMFTYTGAIEIMYIIGTVTTAIQNQATVVQLYINPDSIGNYNITDNTGDIDNATLGTLLEITGTAANAVVITAGGALAPATQVNPIVATCRTSGVIGVTYGAASTGAVRWDMCWRPLSPGATVTPT